MVLLQTEKRDVMLNDDRWEVLDGYESLKEIIIPLNPLKAKKMFLARYNEVVGSYTQVLHDAD